MRRFTQLFTELDRTKRSGEKLAALERYFRETPPADAAWGLHFLSGKKIKRLAPRPLLRGMIEGLTGLPDWLVGESHEAVGDLAETMSLLLPDAADEGFDLPLHQLMRQRLLPMRTLDEASQREMIARTWRELNAEGRFVFNKLITGNFRVGVAATMIVKALAAAADVPVAVMAQRFSGRWEPSAESFMSLMTGQGLGDGSATGSQPYPFFLGYPLEVAVETLGDPRDWIAEWKYDGIRAQVIQRGGHVMIWSRGEELITGAFPEIAQAAALLPSNVVLDGEILAWENERPLPFAALQRRLNRVQVELSLFPEVPVRFIAFDLLEHEGADQRNQPLRDRQTRLQALFTDPAMIDIALAPRVEFASWDELTALQVGVRERGVEGVMLKRADGVYGVGRRRGDWWKWKINPLLLDAVLIYAQAGSGRRSGLFTDYTFGVWSGEGPGRELVPIAKAYSGLTDAEIKEVDRFIRHHTLERHGPVRIVKPELVFELAFQGVQKSGRHKAGWAVRFPRMNRWRKDKSAADADTIDTLRAMAGAAG